MIYISTGGFQKLKPNIIVSKLIKSGIRSIELSGGQYYDVKKISNFLIKKKSLNFSLHNYFPVPKKNFVINLASFNQTIYKKTLLNLKKSILISNKLKSKFFSFHAGFLFDPEIKDLGKRFRKVKLQNRKKTENLFLRRLNILAKEAKKKNVKILIENNVITKINYKKFNQNPFLLTYPDEIINFLKKCDKNIGLLLDVGHLKVSSKTLGFDLYKAHEKLKPFIDGYHLSDNDGRKDTNDSFTNRAWFYNNLKLDVKYISIEVYSKNLKKLKTISNLIKKKYSNEY